jgi:RNA polymerase sigma factor (sigma-70 family)
MEKLDDTERLIMQLTIFEDKTIVQIAHELKLSKSQVGRKQLEAKQKLKKEFCEFLGKNHE